MKADKYSKIASGSLIVLFAVILVVAAMFFCFGEAQQFVLEGEEAQQMKPLFYPQYTDALIILCYVMFALSLVLSLFFGLVSFIKNLVDDAKAAIKGLVPVLFFLVVCAAIIACSATMVDAVLYLQYALFLACTVCAIVGMIGVKRSVGK